MKGRLSSFPLGAHIIIDETTPEARIAAHEIAIRLIRYGHDPEVGPVVAIDSRDSEISGVRVVLLAGIAPKHPKLVAALRDAADSVGIEIVPGKVKL